MIGLGVTVGREGHRDHRGADAGGRCQGGADQGDRGEVGGAVPGEHDQGDRAERAELVQLGLGQCVDHRHERVAGMLLADLLRGQVVTAEGSVLRVGQRSHGPPAAPERHVGQGQPLRIDQLDAAGLLGSEGHRGGECERDGTAGLVEGHGGEEGATHQQLEVIELALRGAVLGGSLIWHGRHPLTEGRAGAQPAPRVGSVTSPMETMRGGTP